VEEGGRDLPAWSLDPALTSVKGPIGGISDWHHEMHLLAIHKCMYEGKSVLLQFINCYFHQIEDIQSLYVAKEDWENRHLEYRGTVLQHIEEGNGIEKKVACSLFEGLKKYRESELRKGNMLDQFFYLISLYDKF
jgi:hypothetical protein